MSNKKLRVLLIVEQCNPDWPSVPLVAYNFFKEISKIVDVTLVTHERNREAFEKHPEHKKVVYITESAFIKNYHHLIANIAYKGKVIWPLYHTLSYPVYAEFNHKAFEQFKDKILEREYDLVHALTPMMPRYPVKAIKACKHVPFLLGPVNGGVPFPEGFRETAKKEYASLNFLRAVGRSLIPGYVETYKKADRILAGSTYTLNLLTEMFTLPDSKISLFYENGISKDFFVSRKVPQNTSKINLLFVGRLVPYKRADIVIEAISQLKPAIQEKIHLIIVGDGSEKINLEQKVQAHSLANIVNLVGWVNQQETREYYRNADVFCFPSIREFGGTVVLEAMACGLPCIVVNNGGIGEYVTEETGFKIEPCSREYLTQELKNKIEILVKDEQLRQSMSDKSIERVREFEWGQKAKKIIEVYEEVLEEKGSSSTAKVGGGV